MAVSAIGQLSRDDDSVIESTIEIEVERDKELEMSQRRVVQGFRNSTGSQKLNKEKKR